MRVGVEALDLRIRLRLGVTYHVRRDGSVIALCHDSDFDRFAKFSFQPQLRLAVDGYAYHMALEGPR